MLLPGYTIGLFTKNAGSPTRAPGTHVTYVPSTDRATWYWRLRMLLPATPVHQQHHRARLPMGYHHPQVPVPAPGPDLRYNGGTMAALTPPYNGGGSLSLATMAVLTGGYNGGGSARVAQVSSI
eukprot:1200793-Rhodomonas_salina.2